MQLVVGNERKEQINRSCLGRPW